MKGLKVISLLLVLIMVFAMSGCNKTDSSITDSDSIGSESEIIDLTKMSSTMVYSEMYIINSAPEEYKGKKIRVRGEFYVYYDEVTKKNYFSVTIQDKTSCCLQGLEFIVNGDYSYPEDYPPEMTEIEICGIYDSYIEDGITYYYIAVDDFKVL